MKITEDILKALKEAVKQSGFKANFARKARVDKANLTRWINGAIKTISDDSWLKLEPFLKPYMNTEQRVTFHPGAEGKGKEPQTAEEGIENDPNLTPKQKKELLLRLREMELDREFGITDDETEGHNPTSGAVAG